MKMKKKDMVMNHFTPRIDEHLRTRKNDEKQTKKTTSVDNKSLL